MLERHAVMGGGAYLGRALALQCQQFQWGSLPHYLQRASSNALAGFTCLHRVGLHRAATRPPDDDSNQPRVRLATGASRSAEHQGACGVLAVAHSRRGLATLAGTRKVENAAQCLPSAYWPIHLAIPARLPSLPFGTNEHAGPPSRQLEGGNKMACLNIRMYFSRSSATIPHIIRS